MTSGTPKLCKNVSHVLSACLAAAEAKLSENARICFGLQPPTIDPRLFRIFFSKFVLSLWCVFLMLLVVVCRYHRSVETLPFFLLYIFFLYETLTFCFSPTESTAAKRATFLLKLFSVAFFFFLCFL